MVTHGVATITIVETKLPMGMVAMVVIVALGVVTKVTTIAPPWPKLNLAAKSKLQIHTRIKK